MRGRGAQAVDRRSRAGVETEARPQRASVTAVATGSWLLRGNDERLAVYALVAGGVRRWTETAVGSGRWSGPDFFPVDGLTALTVAQGANRYVHFLGRRRTRPASGEPKTDLLYAVQYQSGRTLGEWRSLGNPYRDPKDAASLGVPAAAIDGQGSVHVFVSGAPGGVMLRRESKSGAWEAWQDLRGGAVAGGLAAAANSAGLLEVLAPGNRSVMRWVQTEPGAVLRRAQDLMPAAVPGSAALLETAPGVFTAYWSEQSGTGVYAQRPGEWAVPAGGAPGEGPHATLRAAVDGYDCTLLAHQGRTGTAVLGVCGTGGESGGLWWTDTGVTCAGTPALALDGLGRVVMAMVAADGTVLVNRQRPEPGLTLSDWEPLPGD
ncbi:hypothetical protein NHG22_28195 [Streptomyces sp. ATE26]|uniref:hypothetical protein n=1 Tax=unclassified Streptomyces TaxID=2593676 RepID=UPI00116D2D14|nr:MULTISPECIES: hypothetical protein [unclassified Streptomyces]MDI1457658.1 hypothetical protein [Streptomyces sp. ATE26]GEJ99985.1 hypothetical protein TNCT1_22620 [Streptomyces sp. 1-11]